MNTCFLGGLCLLACSIAVAHSQHGLKITWDDKWVHLRGSNTEPIIRIYAEALSEEIATQLIKKVKDQISAR